MKQETIDFLNKKCLEIIKNNDIIFIEGRKDKVFKCFNGKDTIEYYNFYGSENNTNECTTPHLGCYIDGGLYPVFKEEHWSKELKSLIEFYLISVKL